MVVRALVVALLLSSTACGFHPRDRGQPTKIARDRSGAALTFGDIDQVEGTRFFTVPIVRTEHENRGSFSSYAGSDERNRLIVDSTTGASRRVLPNTDFSIVNWIEPKAEMTKTGIGAMEEAAEDGGKARPSGIYAAVVKRPGKTDKDSATYDLLFGRFEDGKQVWAASGLAGVEAVWLTPDRKLAVVAASAKGGIFRLYDPVSFGQLLEKDLAL
jgi:hypothetical protein